MYRLVRITDYCLFGVEMLLQCCDDCGNALWCSKPRWLGPCVCPESRSEARIPQIPEALHLLRAGENCRQAHPLLRAQVNLPELPLALSMMISEMLTLLSKCDGVVVKLFLMKTLT